MTLENISAVGAIAALYQDAEVQTCRGGMSMRERLRQRVRTIIAARALDAFTGVTLASELRADPARVTLCCSGRPDELFRCGHCRRLCCWCVGHVPGTYCDDCATDLEASVEALRESLRRKLYWAEVDGYSDKDRPLIAAGLKAEWERELEGLLAFLRGGGYPLNDEAQVIADPFADDS